MPEGYSSHADYIRWVKEDAQARQRAIEAALRKAFRPFIERRTVDIVFFSKLSAADLANAISQQPLILKPLLAACNLAARAVERDLNIKNLNTYRPKVDSDEAKLIAGYLKPFLPPYLELPTLVHIDRIYYVDKEIRKTKGRWERRILKSLNSLAVVIFQKRRFESQGEVFEIDAATPERGNIHVAIDVKRIEARRDIHKRCDEITNKATNLKKVCPGALFGAVLYYPFIEEQTNISNRLRSDNIDALVFAGEDDDSINSAIKMILRPLKVKLK